MGLSAHSPQLDAATRRLIRYKARQLVGNYGFDKDDRPDIEGELILDLLARLPKFDGSRAALSTFVCRVVNHRVARLIEERTAALRDFRRRGPSLSRPTQDDTGQPEEQGDTLDQDNYLRMLGRQAQPVAEQAALQVDLAGALAQLSASQRRLCAGLAAGRTVKEIAAELGLHRSSVYQQIKQIRAVFIAAGLNEYL